MAGSAGFSEMSRKWLHVSMGGFALLLAWLSWWQALLLALVALAHNAWFLPLYARRKVFRGEAATRGQDIGILLYPASIALLIVVFHRHLEIVAAAWGLLAFGDGFATIAGKTLGGPRLPWNRAKSWAGLAAFLVFGFLAARYLYVLTAAGQSARSPAAGAAVSLAAGQHALFAGWTVPIFLMIGATTLLAAILESLPIGVDDNILVPVVSGGFLFALTLVDGATWKANAGWVLSNLPWAIAINVVLAAAAYAARSVSLSGVVGGVVLGGALYALGGWRAFMMLVLFFVLGTATTKMGHAKKASLGIAQEKGGRRGAKNAVANCGMGALLAFVSSASPYQDLALLGLVAAFATAACDTVGSEIGQAFGRTPYLVTNFRRVPPGTDGAVSLEGTLAGIAAAAMIAAAAFGLGLVTGGGAIVVIAAAFFGSTLESWMGATWERAKLIDNEAINFANTLAGALFAIAMPALAPGLSLLAAQ